VVNGRNLFGMGLVVGDGHSSWFRPPESGGFVNTLAGFLKE
jgi:hypothetical protein